MNFNIKFLIFFLAIIDISADELTINISGQTKAGILNLGIYNNAAAYDQSVQGEERSERGLFSGIDSYIELKESHEFFINLPEGTYAIALFVDANENLKIDLEIDGGINIENCKTAIDAGANVLVSGSTIFKQNNGDLKKNISLLRSS